MPLWDVFRRDRSEAELFPVCEPECAGRAGPVRLHPGRHPVCGPPAGHRRAGGPQPGHLGLRPHQRAGADAGHWRGHPVRHLPHPGGRRAGRPRLLPRPGLRRDAGRATGAGRSAVGRAAGPPAGGGGSHPAHVLGLSAHGAPLCPLLPTQPHSHRLRAQRRQSQAGHGRHAAGQPVQHCAGLCVPLPHGYGHLRRGPGHRHRPGSGPVRVLPAHPHPPQPLPPAPLPPRPPAAGGSGRAGQRRLSQRVLLRPGAGGLQPADPPPGGDAGGGGLRHCGQPGADGPRSLHRRQSGRPAPGQPGPRPGGRRRGAHPVPHGPGAGPVRGAVHGRAGLLRRRAAGVPLQPGRRSGAPADGGAGPAALLSGLSLCRAEPGHRLLPGGGGAPQPPKGPFSSSACASAAPSGAPGQNPPLRPSPPRSGNTRMPRTPPGSAPGGWRAPPAHGPGTPAGRGDGRGDRG